MPTLHASKRVALPQVLGVNSKGAWVWRGPALKLDCGVQLERVPQQPGKRCPWSTCSSASGASTAQGDTGQAAALLELIPTFAVHSTTPRVLGTSFIPRWTEACR